MPSAEDGPAFGEVVSATRAASRRLLSRAEQGYARTRSLVEPPPGALEGKAAEGYLLAQIAKAEEDCAQQVRAFPSHWWLLYLRAVSPVLFSADNPGGYARFRGYPEALSASSQRVLGPVNMPWTGAQFSRVIRFIGSCRVVEELRNIHRISIATGVQVVPAGDDFELSIPENVRAAQPLHNRQLMLNDAYSATTYTGASLFPPLGWQPADDEDWSEAFVSVTMPPLLFTPEQLSKDPGLEDLQFFAILNRLVPDTAAIDWSAAGTEKMHALRVVAAVLRIYVREFGENPPLFRKAVQLGIGSKSAQDFPKFISRVAKAANEWATERFPKSGTDPLAEDDVVRILLDATPARVGRYFGPVVRSGEDFAVTDLLAATLKLEALVTAILAKRSTKGSGWRGPSWESTVQERIDCTPWAPSAKEKASIPKNLRLGGKEITDVDAFGASSGELLIVSCKSWQMPDRYQVGDWDVLGKLGEKLLKEARIHAGKVEKLRQNPRGDNYDLSMYERISGSVCVSAPFLHVHLLGVGEAPAVPIEILPELEARLKNEEVEEPDAEFWQDLLRVMATAGDGEGPGSS